MVRSEWNTDEKAHSQVFVGQVPSGLKLQLETVGLGGENTGPRPQTRNKDRNCGQQLILMVGEELFIRLVFVLLCPMSTSKYKHFPPTVDIT